MLQIQVDLHHKHTNLAQACFDADAHHRERQNQQCFVKCNQTHYINLKYIISQWLSLIQDHKENGLVPLRVKNFFQEEEESYTSQKITIKQLPMPILNGILQLISRYKYFTKPDNSMQYYTFELDEESQELCLIITPFCKYKHKCLPMGFFVSLILHNKSWNKSYMEQWQQSIP